VLLFDQGAAGVRQTLAMASLPDSQLSALASSIEDLSGRVTDLAESLAGEHASESAAILYEVERTLDMAARAVNRARRSLPG
jgi:hypothetical protein